MDFTSQAKVAIKPFLLLFCLFSSCLCFSQTSSDSLSVRHLSDSLLKRSITFSWQGGRLTTALEKIQSENRFKLSYSNSKIQHLNATAKEAHSLPLSVVLEQLLSNTGFDFMVVGQTIVIYQSPKASPANTIKNATDSVEKTKVEIPQKHQFSPALLRTVSDYERAIVYRIYKKELKWAAKRNRSLEKHQSDSSNSNKINEKYFILKSNKNSFQYFVSATVGYARNHPKVTSNTSVEWQKDLKWKLENQHSANATLNAGLKMGTFLIGTGIGLHSLNIKTTWEETEKIKPVPGKPAEPGKPEFDTIGRALEERFTIFTLPIFVSYKMNWKKWYGTAGAGIAFDVFSGKQTNPDRHKKYVTEAIKKGEKYSEKYNRFATNLLLEIRAGYSISDHLLISGGIAYHLALSPFYQNMLYELKSNTLVFDVGLMWLLDRNSSK